MSGADSERFEVTVVSAIPGRLRFKVPTERRSPEAMRRISNAFSSLEVSDVDTNVQTGSVLVQYDPEKLPFENIEEAFGEFGATPIFGRRVVERGALDASPTTRVIDVASKLNTRVARATKGADLRLLVPLGLGALSVRQAFRDSPGLKQAPWYVLAWYAFDSFVKLNGGVRTGADRPTERRAVPETEGAADGGAEGQRRTA
jgi:hypothetical protein